MFIADLFFKYRFILLVHFVSIFPIWALAGMLERKSSLAVVPLIYFAINFFVLKRRREKQLIQTAVFLTFIAVGQFLMFFVILGVLSGGA